MNVEVCAMGCCSVGIAIRYRMSAASIPDAGNRGPPLR